MRRSILILEPDSALRRMAGIFLSRSGYRVLKVCNESEAMQLRLRLDPMLDLAFVAMPEGNPAAGLRLIARFREWWPELPLLLASATHSHWTPASFFQQSRISFISKPYTVFDLESAINGMKLHESSVFVSDPDLLECSQLTA